eukprot:12902256-Alexandrium_andersonii.AAC.1
MQSTCSGRPFLVCILINTLGQPVCMHTLAPVHDDGGGDDEGGGNGGDGGDGLLVPWPVGLGK